MTRESLLSFKNLSARYAASEKNVLQSISLSLSSGEILAIIGESGSGKSTLIKAILQLSDAPEITDGDILYQGISLPGLSRKKLQEIRGCGIGAVFQEPGASLNPIRRIDRQFFDALHAHDKNVTLKEAQEKAAALLAKMNFSDPDRILHTCPALLSGGMNQRIAIALALSLKPCLLLLDEPTSALDPTIQVQIINALRDFRKNLKTAMLLVTHNIGTAAVLSDRIAVIRDGHLVEAGSRNDILCHPSCAYTRSLLEAVPGFLKKTEKERSFYGARS